MYMLNLIILTLAGVIGGVAAAIATCRLLWNTFRLVRHPEWDPIVVLVGGILILRGPYTSSPLLQTTALFSSLCAVGCWQEAAAWRALARTGCAATIAIIARSRDKAPSPVESRSSIPSISCSMPAAAAWMKRSSNSLPSDVPSQRQNCRQIPPY